MKNFRLREDDYDFETALKDYEKIVKLDFGIDGLDYLVRRITTLSKKDEKNFFENEVFSLTFQIPGDKTVRLLFIPYTYSAIKKMCEAYVKEDSKSYLSALMLSGISIEFAISFELGLMDYFSDMSKKEIRDRLREIDKKCVKKIEKDLLDNL